MRGSLGEKELEPGLSKEKPKKENPLMVLPRRDALRLIPVYSLSAGNLKAGIWGCQEGGPTGKGTTGVGYIRKRRYL